MKQMFLIFFIAVGVFAGDRTLASSLSIYGAYGLPYASQLGVDFDFGDYFGIEISINSGTLLRTCADVAVTMREGLLIYRPFGGAFFVGAGAGAYRMTISNEYTVTKSIFTIDALGQMAMIKLGWIWGRSNGGFWYGVDFIRNFPLNSKSTIHADGVDSNSQDYKDSTNSLDQFTRGSWGNLTFFRLGWMF